MIKNVPKRVADAINLLWEYSDDACLSGRTREEAEEEGYECKKKFVYKLTFYISYNPKEER